MFVDQAATSTPDGSGQEQSGQQQQPTQEQSGEGKNQSDVDISEKLAQIAKRSRFLEGREKSLTAKEKEFLAREEELSKRYSRFDGLDDVKNPVQVLEKLGYSLDDILEASLSGDFDTDSQSKPKADPKIGALEKKIKDLEELVERQKTESSKKEEERTIAYQKQILQNLIGKNAEKYPFANRLGQDAVEQAWDTIYSHLQETGELLDYEKVVGEIENNAITYLKGFSDIPGFEEKIGLAERLAAAKKASEADKLPIPKEEEKRLFENDPWSNTPPAKVSMDDIGEGDKANESFDHMDDDELLRRASSLIQWNRQD